MFTARSFTSGKTPEAQPQSGFTTAPGTPKNRQKFTVFLKTLFFAFFYDFLRSK
jgi:hypothetical protein